MTTDFMPEKSVLQVREKIQVPNLYGSEVSGQIEAYEIHMGVSQHHQDYPRLGRGGAVDGSGRIAGTYYHGLFDHAEFRASFLQALAASAGKAMPQGESLSAAGLREIQFNRLRDLLVNHLELKYLENILCHPEPRRGEGSLIDSSSLRSSE